jgi:hypothetical protein
MILKRWSEKPKNINKKMRSSRRRSNPRMDLKTTATPLDKLLRMKSLRTRLMKVTRPSLRSSSKRHLNGSNLTPTLTLKNSRRSKRNSKKFSTQSLPRSTKLEELIPTKLVDSQVDSQVASLEELVSLEEQAEALVDLDPRLMKSIKVLNMCVFSVI